MIAIGLVAHPQRLENPADAHWLDVPQARFPHAFLLAPRPADELLQLRHLLRPKLRDGLFDFGKRAHARRLEDPIAPRNGIAPTRGKSPACIIDDTPASFPRGYGEGHDSPATYRGAAYENFKRHIAILLRLRSPSILLKLEA